MTEPVRTLNCAAARRAAEILLEIEAIRMSPRRPFTLTSGRPSPVYIDCRRLISFPRQRAEILDMLAALLEQNIGQDGVECLAGGATAGIPYAAFLADRLALPMTYIRKTAKHHGRGRRIEGVLAAGERVVLVEDMATDGVSKLDFVTAVREAGALCRHAVVVFYYDIFPESRALLAEHGIVLHHLTSWAGIMGCAVINEILEPEEIREMHRFLDDPRRWQEDSISS
ncbi:MAG: orotate phosphoribosyltransferase [Rhodobacteraceae bacterium]|nr:orotate phosphoribosyltransferase [Paracoccaceae bacterium]